MESLIVGEVFEKFKNFPEGVSLSIEDGNIQILITFNGMRQAEINAVRIGDIRLGIGEIEGLAISFLEIEGILDLSDLPIVLRKNFNLCDIPKEDEGYGVTVAAVDVPSGVVKALRVFALSHDFSLKLKELCEKVGYLSDSYLSFKSFDIQSRYQVEDLQKKIEFASFNLKK